MAKRILRATGWLLLTALAACRGGDSETARQTDLSAPAAGARLIGEVTLADSNDAGGIQVYLPGTRLFAITDADGSYAIENVPAGEYKVAARAAGYQPATLHETLTITPADLGQDVRLEARTLTPRKNEAAISAERQEYGAIEGQARVAGESDATTGGMAVQFMVELEGTPYRTNSLSDGKFFFWNLPPDQYRLTARAPGASPRTIDVRVLPGEKASVQIVLAPDQSLREGRITGQVELYDSRGERSNDFDRITVRLLGTSISSTLEPDGTFTLDRLARGRFVLTASGSGFGQAAPVEIDLANQIQVSVNLVLAATEPTPSETGKVVGFAIKGDQNTDDMSGIQLALAGTQASAMTDALGQFTLDKVAPGSYRLIASAQGYKQAEVGPIEVKAGQETEVPGIYLDPDRVGPRVLATEPADGTRNLLIRREIPVMVRFNVKMVPESLRAAIRVEPAVAFSVHTGGEQPGIDFDQVRILFYGSEQEPAARFRTRYTVTIGTEAQDFEGAALEQPYSFSFTTGDPAVIATLPEDKGSKSGLGPNNPVAIYFNAKMDHATLAGEVLRIRPQLAASPNLSVFDDPATGWTRMHISAMWQPDTEYTLTVLRRARTASKDSLMNTPYSFRFRTSKLLPVSGAGPGYTRPSP